MAKKGSGVRLKHGAVTWKGCKENKSCDGVTERAAPGQEDRAISMSNQEQQWLLIIWREPSLGSTWDDDTLSRRFGDTKFSWHRI